MACRRLAGLLWLGSTVAMGCADDGTAVSGTLGDTTSDAADTSDGGGDPSTATDASDPTTAGTASADGSTTDAPGETSGDPDDTTTGVTDECPPPPACDTPLPNPGPTVDWNDGQSSIITAVGGPVHRGRDMFYNPGDVQWVLAKFSYGATDWDLEGERIDLYLLRDCAGEWESLGTTETTYESSPHPTIEGVEDTGGRVYFQIPADKVLGPGRHRVHMFVRGDATGVDMYIEIVEPGTPFFLADIDGTLTTTETEEFTALLTGVIPDVNPSAPEALWTLVERGYRPMYLTARPEFLGQRTREFVEARALPPGIIHTTLNFTGALGDVAVTYKTEELAALEARGLVPAWVFGNTSSDADAYEEAGIEPVEQRIFFQYDDEHGGRRIESYAELVGEFEALDLVCE